MRREGIDLLCVGHQFFAQILATFGQIYIDAPAVAFVAHAADESVALHPVEGSCGRRFFDLNAAAKLLLAEAVLLPEIKKQRPLSGADLVFGKACLQGAGKEAAIRLRRAGHLLGSAYVECALTGEARGKDTRVIFSGDLGNKESPILRPPEQPDGCDILVLESTYGDRRHEDRRNIHSISDLSNEEPLLSRGCITVMGSKRLRGNRTLFEFVLEDDSGTVSCRWWNLGYMARFFKTGDDVLIYGKLSKGKTRAMDHPETEIIKDEEDATIHVNRIVPIYPLTEGLPQRWLRKLIFRLIKSDLENMAEPDYQSAGLPSRRWTTSIRPTSIRFRTAPSPRSERRAGWSSARWRE